MAGTAVQEIVALEDSLTQATRALDLGQPLVKT